MKRATVKAVTTVHSRERLIVDALETVAEQTRPPDVYVVVDDGSTDNTAAHIRGWIETRKPPFPVVFVTQEKRGVAAGRIRGISEGPPCDLVAMLDSDDLWPPDYLEKMCGALEQHPDAVAASCDRKILDVETDKLETRGSGYAQGAATVAMFDRGVPPSSVTVIRTEAYEKIGGYDGSRRYADDADLYLRLSLAGPWVYVPNLSVTIRRNTAKKFNAAAHLTDKTLAAELERVTMYEQFLFDRGGDAVVPQEMWKPELAKRWVRLARTLFDKGRGGEAAWCFDRSATYRPLPLRMRVRRWRAGLRGRPSPPLGAGTGDA